MGLPLARAAERYNYFYTVSYHLLTRTIVAGPHATGRLVWCSRGVCLLSNTLEMDRPAACVSIPPHECKFPHPTPHLTQEGCIVDCDKPFLAGYRAIADIRIARVRQAAACGGWGRGVGQWGW